MAAGSNIGMMEGAFFVPRGELLDWINGLLQLNVTKIEYLASGAAYCSVIDALFPGTVAMNKVNWMARNDFEFVQNYKVLQQAFERNSIQRHIDVDKLIRGKYQDNLEFMQWLKRFFDLNGGAGKDYNAVERRKGTKTPWDSGTSARPAASRKAVTTPTNTTPRPKPSRPPVSQESDSQLAELRMANDVVQKERDFYFGKLRAIELFCQHHEADGGALIAEISKVLYATDDETISVTPDGDVLVERTEEEPAIDTD